MNAFSMTDRVAVVTGGAGLLGQRHCDVLAREGAHVVVADLDRAGAEKVAAGLRASGEAAYAQQVDITSPESVGSLMRTVLKRFGRVDVLVNNAAVDEKVAPAGEGASPQLFEELPLEVWERALRVNVTGTFLCSQVIGGEMARCGRGSIVNVASTYGVVAPDQGLYRDASGTQTFLKSAAYPTTKAAVLGLTRYLASYWGLSGVRVNALSPGGVQNGQDPGFVARYAARTPMGRMAQPSEYEGALLFLASDASSYMTGANLIVDGGWTAW